MLRWNFDNIAIETDRAGNRLFTKSKSRDRIDGAVACAMAVARVVICHCADCQTLSGTAFGTVRADERRNFRLLTKRKLV